MFDAFNYGVPPHGGCAPGLDRIIMLLSENENIREVIDQETYNLQIKSRAGIDILFGDNDIPNIGPLLDPWMEQERIDKLLGN